MIMYSLWILIMTPYRLWILLCVLYLNIVSTSSYFLYCDYQNFSQKRLNSRPYGRTPYFTIIVIIHHPSSSSSSPFNVRCPCLHGLDGFYIWDHSIWGKDLISLCKIMSVSAEGLATLLLTCKQTSSLWLLIAARKYCLCVYSLLKLILNCELWDSTTN